MERPAADGGSWRSGAGDRSQALRLERREIYPGNHVSGSRHSWLLGSARVFQYGGSVDGRPFFLRSWRKTVLEIAKRRDSAAWLTTPMPRTIYFDYNATTPLDPQVREAMLPFLGDVWGNPSSVHHVGRKARAWLDEARERTSAVLGCKPSEVVFTSGGTESVNLAIFGAARLLKPRGRHLITSAVEHHAVLHSCDCLA